MDNRAIGIFDSGLGGLTVVKELREILPNEEIVYLGDTGRVPYGTRSKETIIKYAQQDIAFLMKKNIKMIVAACGTVSSTLPKKISDHLGVPYQDVILPASQEACAMSSHGRIGVVGTTATMKSNAYGKAMRNIRGDVHVFGNACPLLIPIVENGLVQEDNKIAELAVKLYLEPLVKEGIDTLILGCTHFPILYPIFNRLLNYQVTLIDSGRCTANQVKSYLYSHHMLSEREEPARVEYNVTDEIDNFDLVAKLFLGEKMSGTVNQVELE